MAGLGFPDTIHPIHVGLRGSRDDQIAARALADDRIIVSANARDFRKLLAAVVVHPGAILVEGGELESTWRQIHLALELIRLQPAPTDYMVNRVVEVSAAGGVNPFALPESSDDVPS
jgi:predicted nuclease of predicted toxin-antitoxin system